MIDGLEVASQFTGGNLVGGLLILLAIALSVYNFIGFGLKQKELSKRLLAVEKDYVNRVEFNKLFNEIHENSKLLHQLIGFKEGSEKK